MAYGVVYRITCLTNGKCYHGQTVQDPKVRWRDHLRVNSHCHALRHAFAKYGKDSFEFEVLGEASSKEELDELERTLVATSLSPIGYNLKEGGSVGRPSEETRRKISISNKRTQNRPEVRARNSKSVRKALARPEVKARHKAAAKESQNRPEVKRRKSQLMLAIHARPGEKERRSEYQRKVWASYSEEERQQRVQNQRAACSTEQHRAKMSRAAKISLARPDVKAKLKAGIKASMTPERRALMSEHMKKVHARPGEKEARGAAISKAHNTPEGKRKLARRRRRGESPEAWKARVKEIESEDTSQ